MRSPKDHRLNSTGRVALGSLRRVLIAAGMVLCASAMAFAGTLAGTVTNGTTNRPAPGVEVVLMQLRKGMVPVGKMKTDSRGRFHFTDEAAGKETMLLQADFHGVSYYQSVNAGDADVTLVVYNSTADPKTIVIGSHAIMLRPNGGELQVEEQYIVENQTKPPVAFYADKGTFTFEVPDGAQLGQVSTWTSSRIPTLQKTIDVAGHRKAIDWAFRPGKSVVRISYLLPYPSNAATIRTASPYAAMHVFLAAPPGVQVKSDGFNMIGTEEGFNIYGRQTLPAETALAISISGVPSGAAGTGAQPGSGNPSAGAVSTLPGRFRNLTWILAVSLAVLLFLSTMFFWRRSTSQQTLATASGPAARATRGAKSKAKRQTSPAQSVEDAAGEYLDGIKDRLLQLELRHQAGTLSDDDYATERKQVEETLRALLKG